MSASETKFANGAVKKLTPREKMVLQAVAGGDASKVIASNLGISPRTVENHRRNIYSKLGIHSVAQAVRVALQCAMF